MDLGPLNDRFSSYEWLVKKGEEETKMKPTTGPSLIGVVDRAERIDILRARVERGEEMFYKEEVLDKNMKYNPNVYPI